RSARAACDARAAARGRSSPRLLHPRVRGDDEHAQTDAPTFLAELPERDRLLVAAQLRRDLGRDVAALDAALRVPDPDPVRVVLVLRLADEREAAPRREGVVLERIAPVRGAGELHDAQARVGP